MDREGGSGSVASQESEASQESRRQSIARCVQSVLHARQCRDDNCWMYTCGKMKRVLRHTWECQNKKVRGCNICCQLVALSCYHAKTCRDDLCLMPYCLNIKRKLNEWQIQSRQQQQESNNAVLSSNNNLGVEDREGARDNVVEKENTDPTDGWSDDDDDFAALDSGCNDNDDAESEPSTTQQSNTQHSTSQRSTTTTFGNYDASQEDNVSSSCDSTQSQTWSRGLFERQNRKSKKLRDVIQQAREVKAVGRANRGLETLACSQSAVNGGNASARNAAAVASRREFQLSSSPSFPLHDDDTDHFPTQISLSSSSSSSSQDVLIISPERPVDSNRVQHLHAPVDHDVDDQFESSDVDIICHLSTNVCPITQRPLVDAVVNCLCHHAYERSAMKQLVEIDRLKGKRATRCPVAGCQQFIEDDWCF